MNCLTSEKKGQISILNNSTSKAKGQVSILNYLTSALPRLQGYNMTISIHLTMTQHHSSLHLNVLFLHEHHNYLPHPCHSLISIPGPSTTSPSNLDTDALLTRASSSHAPPTTEPVLCVTGTSSLAHVPYTCCTYCQRASTSPMTASHSAISHYQP